MSSTDQIADTPADASLRGWRFALRRAALLLLVLLLGLVILGWTQREQIADDLIGDELASLGIPATYEIADIGPDRQILTDIVIGDPDNPDLTIERVEVELAYGLGVPQIGRITLFKPRLFGSYSDGALSFGALDPAIFDDTSQEPSALPDLDLDIRDGRARIESDYGAIGAKVEGSGSLNDGFTGILAAVGPDLSIAGCGLERASIYGEISTNSGELSIDGPFRVANAECEGTDLAVGKVAWPVKLKFAEDFSYVSADGEFYSAELSAPGTVARSLSGPISLVVGGEQLDADLELQLAGLSASAVTAEAVAFDGTVRSREGFTQHSLDAELSGEGIAIGGTTSRVLDSFADMAEGTLAAPLLRKFSSALVRETRGSRFSASVIGRGNNALQSLVMPEAAIRGAGGNTIMSLSRLQYRRQGNDVPRLSGNFRMGGQGLPQMVGRMESGVDGAAQFRLKIQPYGAGDSAIAIPEMLVTQDRSGAMSFTGAVVASGPLPGGSARNLRVPVSGALDASGALALWRNCTTVAYDALVFANLELNNRSVTLCPAPGSAIVRQNDGELRIAAGIPTLDVVGQLAGTPVAIRSGPIGLAYPGIAKAEQLSVELGPSDAASRVVISDLLANLGEDISGSFSDADMGLAAVPLDLRETAGDWSYNDGVLLIENASFMLLDRAEPDRFEPMPVRGGMLTLADNIVRASASVRSPKADREVSQVSMVHNLDTGSGYADLDVPGLRFDKALQPTDMTDLALGVVANVEGTVTGSGRIDWTVDDVTSSGAFSSESLDLAAAFGPVRGASGTVEFVDLLSLTTAPDQVINVASVNPGIEARDGKIGFSLREGQFLGVTGGEWPFMGGVLTLRPVNLNLGAAEERRYVLEVDGLQASEFIENLELGNLAATGRFDGSLPLVFNAEGFGRIEDGLLQARAPGGNVSYVGDLTYEDMSPIANYTFEMLKSLDYRDLRIEMDGPLTGDIVTQLKFGGVKQGQGTAQNFITRQIADLPIQLNVNIRAPFYKLVTTLRSIYDPSTVRDPRDLGLLTDDGTRFVPVTDGPPTDSPLPPEQPETRPPISEAILPDEPSIQTPDSENVP